MAKDDLKIKVIEVNKPDMTRAKKIIIELCEFLSRRWLKDKNK